MVHSNGSSLHVRRVGAALIAVLAGVGLVASLLVHGSTFFGVDPYESLPYVWALHGGFLLLFALLAALPDAGRRAKPSSMEDLDHAPRWMLAAVGVFFVYALVNSGFFIANTWEGMPVQQADGSFAVSNHGDFVRSIAEDEYHHLRALELRGVSGHWMLFYSLGLSTATSAALEPSREITAPEPSRRFGARSGERA